MDMKGLLKKTELFASLPDADLEELAARGLYRAAAAKEFIFRQGERGSYFYVLLEGTVKAYKLSPEGTETTMKIFHPGEFFGEVILSGSDIYPASAVALTDARVFAVHRESFSSMLGKPGARDRFIASLLGKLRYLTDQVHHLHSLDVEERFFRYLKDTWGERTRYEIPLPRREIAMAIGTIPETFSRLTVRLTRMGLIRWEGDTLTVRDGFWEERLYE